MSKTEKEDIFTQIEKIMDEKSSMGKFILRKQMKDLNLTPDMLKEEKHLTVIIDKLVEASRLFLDDNQCREFKRELKEKFLFKKR